MPIINDPEFGEIIVRKYRSARNIKARRSPGGKLHISAPTYVPNIIINKFIKQSRNELLELIQASTPETNYVNGMSIGKSHSLIIVEGSNLTVRTSKNIITVSLPEGMNANDTIVTDKLRPVIIKSLRKESKSYLPRRLDYIAKQHNLNYGDVKFSHASSRWGSCSSNGTITLNIALMKLPFELIDYVIVHELAHTVQMNHSPSFWSIVESIDPEYKKHRKLLKNETPNL